MWSMDVSSDRRAAQSPMACRASASHTGPLGCQVLFSQGGLALVPGTRPLTQTCSPLHLRPPPSQEGYPQPLWNSSQSLFSSPHSLPVSENLAALSPVPRPLLSPLTAWSRASVSSSLLPGLLEVQRSHVLRCRSHHVGAPASDLTSPSPRWRRTRDSTPWPTLPSPAQPSGALLPALLRSLPPLPSPSATWLQPPA